MSGIFQGDIFIKTAIELGIDDMRKNPWLIDHMLEDLKNNPYTKEKYGEKQIDACKEWLANNKIDVYMRLRNDRDQPPCITIEMGPSNEKEDMKSMADQSTETTILLPNKINKPIPYVIKPFVPTGYVIATGEVMLDPDIDTSGVSEGMILVNPVLGVGYPIQSIGPDGLFIEPGIEIEASQLGIVPQYQYYVARIEHSFFDETYNIGCHAHGDPQTVLWLWAITKYSILRYRESLLEANGFAQSSISSGDVGLNRDWTTPGGEQAFSRYMTLRGQIENSWIKSPRRIIESVVFKKKVPKSCNTYTGGIKIISNLDTPDFIDKSTQLWTTIEDSETDDE